MDFSFTEEQQAISELAGQILEGSLTDERLREMSRTGEYTDDATWTELAKANLLGICLPEDVGGSGLGFVELCLILEQVGRRAAPVPVLATLALGAMPLAAWASPEIRHRYLPAVVSGDAVLTAALVEAGTDPRRPGTTAGPDGAAWRLDGVKVCVPAGLEAAAILVPAQTPLGEVMVFAVDASAPGLDPQRQDTTTGIPEARMELSGVKVSAVDRLGAEGQGAEVLDWMLDRATVATCATTVGVCEQALAMTAEYTKNRKQFDKVIATFQAVGQRAADAYIDTEAVRLTAWQAAWRLAEGLPSSESVAVAKFWAADGGQRVVHAAQHLHGGIGVDRDYPLHRYFLWAKQLELTLGGATAQLVRLGAMLAADPAQG